MCNFTHIVSISAVWWWFTQFLSQGNFCRKFTLFCREAILSQIYALLSVKFPGLKMCGCKKNDKYEVWAPLSSLSGLTQVLSPGSGQVVWCHWPADWVDEGGGKCFHSFQNIHQFPHTTMADFFGKKYPLLFEFWGLNPRVVDIWRCWKWQGGRGGGG